MRKIKGNLNKKAYTMFMDSEAQCYKDINSLLLCRHLQADSTLCIEIQRTQNSQGNLEGQEQR